MDPRRTRRQVLALVASGSLGGSAGCLDTIRGGTSDDSEPTVPDVDCDPDAYPSLSTDIPAGSWSPTRGNQRRTGANLGMDPFQLQDVDELQATELFSYSEVSLPVVANGVVYLTDTDLTSYAIDIETGETIWAVETEANHRFPPVVTRETVYLSGYEATFQALDRDSGEPRWRTQLDVTEGSGRTPVVAGETLIAGHKTGIQDDLEGRYIALDTRCGSQRWSVTFTKERPRGVATDGEMVYAATDHHLSAINAEDGTEHWQVRVTDSTLERPPALAGETVLLSDGGTLYALAATDGSERWNTHDGFDAKHPPTVSSDAVYVVESETNDVLALDTETGQELWRYSGVPGEINSALTEVSGILYAAGDLEREPFRFGILGLDVSTGTKQADATLQSLDRANARTISELAMTPAGVITHAGTTEGGNPELIYRIRPD